MNLSLSLSLSLSLPTPIGSNDGHWVDEHYSTITVNFYPLTHGLKW